MNLEITERMFNLGYLFIEEIDEGEYHIEFHNCAIAPIINKIGICELNDKENALVFAFCEGDRIISTVRFNLKKYKDVLKDVKEWANTHKNVEYLRRAGE